MVGKSLMLGWLSGITRAIRPAPAARVGAAWLAAIVMVPACTFVSAQENWPHWRGPTLNGVAAESAKPPVAWSETTNVKWKAPIPGLGYASPIIWENKIFVQTAVPKSEAGGGGEPVHQFMLLCIDRQTGKVIWEKVAREEAPHEGHHPTSTFASNSAVTDGTNVYAYFGSRGIYCYDMDGNPKWDRDLGDMSKFRAFGEGSSPVLFGDLILINWDHEAGSYITALNKTTGEPVWKTDRDEKTTWTSPVIVEHQGQPQVVVAGSSKTRSYEPGTGKLIWESTGLTRNVIPSPVAGDGVVYVTSGYQGNSLMAIKLGATGDVSGSDSIVWKYTKNTPYVPSPVLVNDRIYMFAGNNPVLTSVEAATGKVVIDAQRLPELNGVYASLMAADGRIYAVGRNGATAVMKQGDTLEILATNKLDDAIDASPVAVDAELYLRGAKFLYCIAED